MKKKTNYKVQSKTNDSEFLTDIKSQLLENVYFYYI